MPAFASLSIFAANRNAYKIIEASENAGIGIISYFGESHGAGIGVVLDGFPSGVDYDEAFILREMERRAPGRNKQSTARREADQPKILSGVFNGKTTGTPICAVIENTNTLLHSLVNNLIRLRVLFIIVLPPFILSLIIYYISP